MAKQIFLKLSHGSIKMSKTKTVPQSNKFECGLFHLIIFFENNRYYLRFTERIFEKETDHDEVFEDAWKNQPGEWLDFVKSDVLCTNLSYNIYSKSMEELTGFGRKSFLISYSLGWKCFYSLRDENDENFFNM